MTPAKLVSVPGSGDLRADRRHGYAVAALAEGDATAARDLFEQCLERAPEWPPGWFGLGEALLALGDGEGARAAFTRARDLDPSDRLGAAAHIARLSGAVGADSLSPAFIAGLFDQYAPRFDAHLVGALDYRAPSLLRDALRRAGAPERFRHVLDLGCGTGLMARALAGHTERIEGADLSAGMLAVARGTGLYARLEQADLVDFLAARQTGTADLIVAADVFCYVADLAPVLAAALPALADGGYFAFTIETHDGAGAVIGEERRVRHALDDVLHASRNKGFAPRLAECAATRRDRGQAVPGALIVLAKS